MDKDIRIGFYHSSIKAVEDGESWKLMVLGAPYGWDKDGERFTPDTNFMLEIGESRPAIYFHGLNVTANGMQEVPEVIGKATAVKRDEQGLWFEVMLDKANKFAKRVWEAAKKGIAKASSGAINHLVRDMPDGTIAVWPIGELSLIDEGTHRHPANPRAVAMPIKSLFETAELEIPQAFETEAESGEEVEQSGEQDSSSKTFDTVEELIGELDMEDTEKQAIVADVSKAVMDAMTAKAEAEKTEAERVAAIKAEAKKESDDEWKAKLEPAFKGGFSINKVAGLGLKADDKKSFEHWIRTGDQAAIKAAIQEDTTTEGGYAVPNDFLEQFIAKRQVVSGVRRAGVKVIQTNRDYLDIAAEDTTSTTFVRTAEEGAFDENEVNMTQVQIRVYKWTKAIKVSTEFLEDDGANVMDFVMNDLAVKAAQTEDRYVLNGTGTNQHKGIMALVSTEANWLDFDSTGNITADEIPELLYKLNSAYRANSSWFMHNSVEAYLRKIRDTSLFAFQPVMDLANGLSAWSQLLGRPVFNEANMTSSLATGNQVIMVGDMSYYALVERKGLVVSRNPYLYEANGQVGIFAHFRQGGAPLQYEAFAIGEMA
jgi:HK97 family phage major capsid protein